MKFAKLALLATTLAAAPYAAYAQDAGTTIYGNDDQPIGTVESNDGTTVVVDTGKHKAPIPAAAIGQREIGYSLNATLAQVNGMMDQQVAQQQAAAAEAQAKAEAEAKAALAAALVPGAEVITADAQPLGTVSELTEENVIVTNDEAGLITLPVTLMATDAEGGLVARANFDAIMAAVQGG